jgi:hypothetical protein
MVRAGKIARARQRRPPALAQDEEDCAMHDDSPDQAAAQRRIARLVFGGMALVAILAGLAIWRFPDALGLDEDMGKMVATLFGIVGIVDLIIVTFVWDRLFASRS